MTYAPIKLQRRAQVLCLPFNDQHRPRLDCIPKTAIMSTETTPLLPQFATPSNATVDAAKKTAFSAAEAMAALKAGSSSLVSASTVASYDSLTRLSILYVYTGKMPTHQQFDKLVAKALDSDVLSLGVGAGRTGRLSEEGARVVKAFRDVLQAVRNVGEQKNGLFYHFYPPFGRAMGNRIAT
jgi:hypothetical protein